MRLIPPNTLQIVLSFALMLQGVLSFSQDSWKFDFGEGALKKGYIPVGVKTLYNDSLGYGFDFSGNLFSHVSSVTRDPLTADYISSAEPFFFSVLIPEGNYDVEVVMGDIEGSSATIIRAECRRAMSDLIVTKQGEISSLKFTVHVRDTMIRTNGALAGFVKLKPRERDYLHWDRKLTLEFNGIKPKICGLTITPNKKAQTVFLAGNSTVVDQDKEPWAAWGQMIPAFFKPGAVAIANYAESGEALASFKSARRLEKILSLMKRGDYLFIEFGHNDQKQKGPNVGPWTSYSDDLRDYIKKCRNRGGIPVLITSMNRRSFDSSGKIMNTLGDYPAAVRKVALEEKVALIDLNQMSKILYESWGIEGSFKAFVHYPANSFPSQDKPLMDNTHFSTYGAYHIALCIAKGIVEANLALASQLKENLPFHYILHPMKFEDWYWPLSRLKPSQKPDGN
jgi:lysophospholipase L1-like esterase